MPSDPSTTATLFFCGSGNNMSAYKREKFAIPIMFHSAQGNHRGFDGVGGNDKQLQLYKTTGMLGEYVVEGGQNVYIGPESDTKVKTRGC